MKPPVGPRQRRGIIEQRPILFDKALQNADFFLRRVARRQTGGQPFKFDPHDIEVAHLGVIQRGDDQAAPIARQQ